MLIRADARAIPLAAATVDCVVTSPPYWGLRDYGSANQIGLEATPDAYVAQLVTVFREVRRVLRDAGTVWLNLGDSYATVGGATPIESDGRANRAARMVPQRSGAVGIKPKDLVGIPWRVAFALQADGWYLRSDIIWAKPNPMPESVTDRPTKAHEYIFLLSKSDRYFYDAAAIREQFAATTLADRRAGNGDQARARRRQYDNGKSGDAPGAILGDPAVGRNKRSVWMVQSEPYTGAHFATFPEALIEPCILAGCPIGGLVLDPFIGSGTVGAVADRISRRWVGIDLAYQDLSRVRTAQAGLMFA